MIKKFDNLLNKLFPLNRSISSSDNIKTLKILKKEIPINIKKFQVGKKVFDWKIPKEWKLYYGSIVDTNTKKVIINSKNNNLHVVSYSKSVNKLLSWKELNKHLFTHTIRDAIPYRTTYYKKNWGFCLSKNHLNKIKNLRGPFKVNIKSSLKNNDMPYGELVIKGKSNKEILISTYICHPSMANDNLSGLLVTAFLAKKILSTKNNYYTYRIIFVPETIGAIAYSYFNYKKLKSIDSCIIIANVGGPGDFSYKQSYDNNHFLNSVIESLFKKQSVKYKKYKFDINGSDERQFSSVGLRVNCCSIFKDKYYEYKYYHTSKDDLNFVKSASLEKSLKIYTDLYREIEKTRFLINLKPNCEVMLSKYGLHSSYGGSFKPNKKINSTIEIYKWILFLSDGKNSIDQICVKLNIEKNILIKFIDKLIKKKLLKYA